MRHVAVLARSVVAIVGLGSWPPVPDGGVFLGSADPRWAWPGPAFEGKGNSELAARVQSAAGLIAASTPCGRRPAPPHTLSRAWTRDGSSPTLTMWLTRGRRQDSLSEAHRADRGCGAVAVLFDVALKRSSQWHSLRSQEAAMQKLKDRTYVAAPSETVTITLTLHDGRPSEREVERRSAARDCFPLPSIHPGAGRACSPWWPYALTRQPRSADPRRAATRKVRSDCEA